MEEMSRFFLNNFKFFGLNNQVDIGVIYCDVVSSGGKRFIGGVGGRVWAWDGFRSFVFDKLVLIGL